MSVEIKRLVKELIEKLKGFRPSAFVAAAYLQEIGAGVERRKGRDGQIALAEYIALLLLPRFNGDVGATPTFKDVEDALELALEIFDSAFPEKDGVRSEPIDGTLSERLRLTGLIMRVPGVPEHWEELLYRFATSFDPDVEEILGISLVEVMRCVDGCIELLIAKKRAHDGKWKGRAVKVWRAFQTRDKSDLDQEEATLVAELRKRRRSSAKRRIQGWCWEQSFGEIGAIMTLTPPELASQASVSVGVAQRFFDILTVPASDANDEPTFPSSSPPLGRTPFIRLGPAFFLPQPTLLIWAVLPRIEALINPDAKGSIAKQRSTYRRYERKRTAFLESMTAEVLGVLSDRTLSNATYIAAHGSDEEALCEIDTLARFDTTLYVVECKASTLSEATRRGAPLSVRSNLLALLEEGVVQNERAISVMQRQPDNLPEPLRRISAGVQEFISIIVTLDHTGAINTGLAALRNELRQQERPFWPISLLDLYSLSKAMTSPWRFKHYARRRLQMYEDGRDTIAVDEFDFYDCYVRFNCCAFPKVEGRFVVMAPTNDLTEYFAYLGDRFGEERRLPEQRMDRGLIALIAVLQGQRQTGWSDVVCDMLDLGFSARRTFAKAVERAQENSRMFDGIFPTAIHGELEDGEYFGIIYVASSDVAAKEMLPLVQYTIEERYLSSGRWLIMLHEMMPNYVTFATFALHNGAWTPTPTGLQLGEKLNFVPAQQAKDKST